MSNYSTPYQGPEGQVSLSERQRICEGVVGVVAWGSEGDWGYCACPGMQFHTGKDGKRDCRVFAAEAHRGGRTNPPGVYCLHTSCSASIEEAQRRIRSAIGKAKFEAGRIAGASPRPISSPLPPVVGQKAVRDVRTVRTGNFGVPEEKDGRLKPVEPEVRTPRTDQTYPLTRFAHVRAQVYSSQEGQIYPSEASGVVKAEKQPTPAPKPQPIVQPIKEAPISTTEEEGEVTISVKGGSPVRGRFINGEFVPKFTFKQRQSTT